MSAARPTPDSFSTTQKALHWAVVVLIALQYTLLEGMGRPYHQLMDTGVAHYSLTVVLHIGVGATVLVLAIWRLVLRARHGVPPEPEAEPELFRKLSKLAHGAIYVLLFAFPLSGAVAWFGGVGAAAEAHEIIKALLMVLVVLHVGAVVVHQLVWKTNIARRMI